MRTDSLTRLAAPLVGVALAAIGLLSWRVPPVDELAGLTVSAEVSVNGTLRSAPSRILLSSVEVQPGVPAAHGTPVVVTSITGRPLRLRPTLHVDDHVTTDLHVRLTADGAAVFAGAVGDFAHDRVDPLAIEPGDAMELRLAVRLPADAPDGYQGRATRLTLVLDDEPVG